MGRARFSRAAAGAGTGLGVGVVRPAWTDEAAPGRRLGFRDRLPEERATSKLLERTLLPHASRTDSMPLIYTTVPLVPTSALKTVVRASRPLSRGHSSAALRSCDFFPMSWVAQTLHFMSAARHRKPRSKLWRRVEKPGVAHTSRRPWAGCMRAFEGAQTCHTTARQRHP